MVLQILSRAAALLWPYLFWKIIGIAQVWWPWMRHNMLPYVVAAMLVPLINRAFHGPSRIIESKLAFEATKNYKMYLYHQAISLPISWQTDNHSWETIDKINKASDALFWFSSEMYGNIGTFVSFFWAVWALMLIRPTTAVVMIALWVVIILLVQWFDKWITYWIKEENKKAHKVTALLVDYLSNIRTLITLRFLSPTEKTLINTIQHVKTPFMKHAVRNEWKWFSTDMILEMVIMILLLVYIYNTWKNTWVVVLWVLTMIWQYLQRMSSTFYQITWSYGQVMRRSANVASVEGMQKDYDRLVHNNYIDENKTLLDWHRITLSDLWFAYNGKTENIVDNVSISLHKEQKIALVWESWSGKSTILSLLRWLYQPHNVNVVVDDEYLIWKNTLSCIADQTSLIPQEPEIFEETILFNITMGSDISQEQVEMYAKMAMFHDIAVSLPHGYETSIKEKWVNLSGWQKQRLALARGLMAAEDSDILLLDESTSSVDSINEKKIYQNIFTAYPQKTIVAAIHKLHLLPMFDIVYVFDKGKIVEHWAFQELIASQWIFAKMWEEYTISVEQWDEE